MAGNQSSAAALAFVFHGCLAPWVVAKVGEEDFGPPRVAAAVYAIHHGGARVDMGAKYKAIRRGHAKSELVVLFASNK
jgi:hypothetical protein